MTTVSGRQTTAAFSRSVLTPLKSAAFQRSCSSVHSCVYTHDQIRARTQATGHFTFWISLSQSGIATYTHRPQGVNYRGYLHVIRYLLLIIILKEKGVMQTKSLADVQFRKTVAVKRHASLFVCINPFCLSIIIMNGEYLRTRKYP